MPMRLFRLILAIDHTVLGAARGEPRAFLLFEPYQDYLIAK